MSDVVRAERAPKPVGAYPHARRVGNLLFLCGVGPRDAQTNAIIGNVYDADGKLISYDIDAQCRAVFANVRAVLEASGARWEDLVDVTVFLTDMNNLGRYREVRNRFFATVTPPAAPAVTLVEVSKIYGPDFMIEIEAIAAA